MLLGVKQQSKWNDDRDGLLCPMLLEVKQPCARGETDAMSDIIGGKNHRIRHDSLYDIIDFYVNVPCYWG